ncbi:hypothetical protein LZ554_006498 [Drepanopeziza brunnea f. sp. 'monogermtubi']|nr:hypothetical protein LZ554_006498 [Drepanopeziza brunnea f. sp. 'monogermtubi']
MGRPAEGNRLDEEGRDPPETPAPVFAARALKSAIFGTPAPPIDDDTVFEEERQTIAAGRERAKLQARSWSPNKPPGILLTPGTATTRRKTVSFGNEIENKQDEKRNAIETAGLDVDPDDFTGNFPSPFVAKSDTPTKPARKTTLTKALENAREGKAAKSETTRTSSEPQPSSKNTNTTKDKNVLSSEHGRQQSSRDTERKLEEGDTLTGEMTMDLNQPHSQSGRYWKSEYESYHEQALAEMKKLIGYKQLVKQYAKLKDAENIDLSEKLKEYKQAIVSMEDKISQLSSRVTRSGIGGNDDRSPELVKELARHTALSVQYKSKVAEFEAVLEDDHISNSPVKQRQNSSHRSEETKIYTTLELVKAREQLTEMASLRDEVQTLRQSLSTAEKSTQKLQEENIRLTEQLLHANLRFEKHIEKCEKKRKSVDEQRQKRDEVVQNLQSDYDKLREAAKSQRRDSEHLLRKRHEQIVELKQEIASLRGAGSTAQELQRALQGKDTQHDRTIFEYETQIENLKAKQELDSTVESSLKDKRGRHYNAPNTASKPHSLNENAQVRESFIPVSSQSISRPSKVLMSSKIAYSQTPNGSPRRRSSHSALSELVNFGKNQPTPFQRSGPVQHTPLTHVTPLISRFSNMSLDSPDMQLPSPEPSLPRATSRAIHERSCHPNHGPSMFNIASSPPKAAIVRPRVSNELPRQKSNSNMGSRLTTNLASSRGVTSDTARVRGSIPPERAAAAKARLEQKQAEKRRAQAANVDKENILN